MHTPAPAPDPDDYTWPACTGCTRPLWDTELGRYTCRPCQTRAAEHLATIAALYPHLNTTSALLPRRSGTHTRSGTRTAAPLPVAVAVLDLTAPGGVATRLAAIEDAWRLALGRRIPVRHDHTRVFAAWRTNPTADVPQHVTFLRINLERACESYPEIGDDLTEIRRLHDQCKTAALTALDPGEQRPGPIAIGPCPAVPDGATTPCMAPLTARPGAHRVDCRTCGARWEGARDWIALRTAQQALTAAAA